VAEVVDGTRDRCVQVDTHSAPGQVVIAAYLPPVEGIAVAEALEKIAGRFTRADGRSKDQRLADALIGCVLGFADPEAGVPSPPKIELQLTVDLPTLLHLREHPGELGRYGALPAPLVRSLAGDVRWRRFVFDPVDGHLLDSGSVVPPPAELDRYVRDSDVYCRYPFSNRSARRADLDHAIPHGHPGGDTSAEQLHALCRPVHRAKTHSGLRIRSLPGGRVEWTTPRGRVYRTRPHDYRPMFDDPPDPPDPPDFSGPS